MKLLWQHMVVRGNVHCARCLFRIADGGGAVGVGEPNVVTTGIKPSSNIGSALVWAMYGRSSELGLYQTYTSAHPFDTLVTGLAIVSD